MAQDKKGYTSILIEESFDLDATGTPQLPFTRLRTCPFGQFEVKIATDADGKFLDVVAISVSQDFLSSEQRAKSGGRFDVDKYYYADGE